jgi:hypothetical protein
LQAISKLPAATILFTSGIFFGKIFPAPGPSLSVSTEATVYPHRGCGMRMNPEQSRPPHAGCHRRFTRARHSTSADSSHVVDL